MRKKEQIINYDIKRNEVCRMLYYKIYGNEENEPVILIHGIGGNHRIFYKQLKEYSKYFQVIAIDLLGHGKSPGIDRNKKPTFEENVDKVVELMDHLQIEKAHFVGVSLGSIIIHQLLKSNSERVKSATFAGGITTVNIVPKTILLLGFAIRKNIPYMWLYTFFAHILMPKKNHEQSRIVFIKEAKTLGQFHFTYWLKILRYCDQIYNQIEENIVPKLYISGSEDHMFYHTLKKDIQKDAYSTISVIENCGHVCNIERSDIFNEQSINFIQKHSN